MHASNASVLYRLTAPEFISESVPQTRPQAPSIYWGRGSFKKSPESHCCLLIGWGRYLLLLKLLYPDDEFRFIEGACAIFAEPIIFCGYLSHSIVIAVFGTRLAMIHTNKFELSFKRLDRLTEYFQSIDLSEFGTIEFPAAKHIANYRFFFCSFARNELYFVLPATGNFVYARLQEWLDFFT